MSNWRAFIGAACLIGLCNASLRADQIPQLPRMELPGPSSRPPASTTRPPEPTTVPTAKDTTDVIVTFRGGTIDDNIVAFYDHLRRIGALPTKTITPTSGKSAESLFYEQNVLFGYHPASFNSLLGSLNRNKTGYRPGADIVVPDLKLAKYEYVEVVNLSGEPLAAVAEKRYLYRPYDVTGKRLEITRDKSKQLEVARLNPKLPTTNVWRMSDGRILFPAEGFVTRVSVPKSMLEKVLSFSRPNVFLTPAVTPTLKSFAPRAPERNAFPQPTPAAPLTCSDPLSADFNLNLSTIAYELPANISKEVSDLPSIVVVDKFPPLSAERRSELSYISGFRKLYDNDDAIDATEQKVLKAEQDKLNISDTRAAEIQDLVKNRQFSDFRRDLSDQLEFQNASSNVSGTVVNETDPAIDVSLDHGLHIAGIIAAHCNKYGIAGMIPFASVAAYSLGNSPPDHVLPITVLNDLIDYCRTRFCILNASWAISKSDVGPEFIESLKQFTEEFLIVAAAGDKEGQPGARGVADGGELGGACDLIPACLGEQSNVITVTAFLTDQPNTLDSRANFTSKGKNTVALAAPGQNVLSAVRGSNFTKFSGTSQATAFVTGTAALIQGLNDSLTVRQVKNRLLYTADLDFNYGGKVAFGKLNVKRAVSYLTDDTVYIGNAPKLGFFEYNEPLSRNATLDLLLFVRGRKRDVIRDCRVANVRRIAKNPGSNYFTVVYESLETGELKVAREVTFTPEDDPTFVGEGRLTGSFKLKTCTAPRPTPTLTAREWIRGCPTASQKTEPIDLRQVTDLIVRADTIKSRR